MSFTLNYTGDEINAILARANNGGEIDDELALKAPLASPALTGNPTAPTQPEEDSSTKIATTEYADRAADAAGAVAEAAAKEYTDAATGALYITDTASGSIASFADGADGVAMRSVVVNITPVQSGSGDPSPDNVRPISGWTGAEIGDSAETPALTYDIEQGTINSDGANLGSTTRIRTKGYLSALAGESCVVHVDSEQALDAIVFFYQDNNAYISSTLFAAIPAEGLSVTPPANTAKIRIVFRLTNSPSSDILPSVLSKVWLNDITFYSVSWSDEAGEVYGGTIDVVSGELKVTHRYIMPTSITSTALDGALAQISISNDPAPASAATAVTGIVSSHLVTVSQSTLLNSATLNGVALSPTGINIQFKIEGVSGKTAFDEWCAANNPQFVYPLAQPVVYRLSAQQITSLLGANNVWSNTGDTEVTYVADPKLYIAKMLGGGALALGSASPLSVNRPVTISEEDLEQAGEVSEAVEAATETVLPAESGETEEEAQE